MTVSYQYSDFTQGFVLTDLSLCGQSPVSLGVVLGAEGGRRGRMFLAIQIDPGGRPVIDLLPPKKHVDGGIRFFTASVKVQSLLTANKSCGAAQTRTPLNTGSCSEHYSRIGS
jgi:hypothetical protein